MQAGTEVTLPGGALIDGRLARSAALHPLTGRLEQRLAALVDAPAQAVAETVSAVLAAALAHVGERPVTEASAARLSVGDRQFLMLALALECTQDAQWRHITCGRCEARFDVGFRFTELPVQPAGTSYPWVDATIAGRRVRLRVPNGEDEAHVARLAPNSARRALALRCVVAIDDAPPEIAVLDGFGNAEIDAIDAALDEVTPQLSTSLGTACNECGAPHVLKVDPYRIGPIDAGQLYRDVHALAWRYHWSEAQILRLPRRRRQLYLALIDQSLGMSH